jgi:hypothetical protein
MAFCKKETKGLLFDKKMLNIYGGVKVVKNIIIFAVKYCLTIKWIELWKLNSD